MILDTTDDLIAALGRQLELHNQAVKFMLPMHLGMRTTVFAQEVHFSIIVEYHRSRLAPFKLDVRTPAASRVRSRQWSPKPAASRSRIT